MPDQHSHDPRYQILRHEGLNALVCSSNNRVHCRPAVQRGAKVPEGCGSSGEEGVLAGVPRILECDMRHQFWIVFLLREQVLHTPLSELNWVPDLEVRMMISICQNS